MADQSALFACTKCHSRHPFEELSQSEQLCKECRNNYPVVKCTYCRAEFQQGKGSTNTICKKCAQNVKAYGKPTACEYCNVIAAFIGNRCQRCTNCEKKYGPPTTCEQCKQKCAFDRSEESCKKVDGKILCWLCTLAYRRVLAKTRNRQEEALKNYGSQRSSLGEMTGSGSRPIVLEESTNSSSSNQDNLDKNKLVDKSARNSESRDKLGSENKRDGSVEPSSADKGTSLGDKTDKHQSSGEKSHHHHRHHHHHHHHRHGSGDKHNHHSSKDKNKDHKSSSSSHKSKTHHSNNKSLHDHSSSKKAKIETTPTSSGTSTTTTTKTSTNGVTPTKSTSMASLSEKSIPDLSSTDHMIAITQLREELEALKKQIQGKDQQIKEREKKITELKAMQYESEKEVRTKINSLQKRHSEAIETLQIKNRDLMKQVASLSRGNKNKSSSIANSDSPAL